MTYNVTNRKLTHMYRLSMSDETHSIVHVLYTTGVKYFSLQTVLLVSLEPVADHNAIVQMVGLVKLTQEYAQGDNVTPPGME